MARTFTASTEASVRPLPCLLQRSVVDDGDSFLIESLACSWRGEELVVGLPDLPAGWLDCLPLVGAVRWVDSPLIEAPWEVSEHLRLCFRLVVEADGEAVHEGVVDNRLASLASLTTAIVEPDACSEAVLRGERHRQFEDVGAAPVGEAVPIEMRGRESGVNHGVDLCTQLPFDLGELRVSEESTALRRRVDVELAGIRVDQRGHV